MFKGNKEIERALYALGEQLAAEGVVHIEIVICGAAALFNLQWYVQDRYTEDVDILAFVNINEEGLQVLQRNTPLWSKVKKAARRVAIDFNLEENWLNRGAVFLTDMGLPDGIMDRFDSCAFGENLIIHFVGRQDLVSLKLFAYLDDTFRPDVHADDLFELKPTDEEMEIAARWSMKINPPLDFKAKLNDGLIKLGYRNVAERI